MARPKGPSPAALRARDVTATPGDAGAYVLTCGQCGATWEVNPARGRLPAGYWQCPNECNTTPAARAPEPAPPAIYTDLAALPAILTPAEAAILLRLSETTVKDWARADRLPGAFKLGKEWRIERDALLAYIRGQEGAS